eukprot:355302-Chlamydomonas_euryale.AAC.16
MFGPKLECHGGSDEEGLKMTQHADDDDIDDDDIDGAPPGGLASHAEQDNNKEVHSRNCVKQQGSKGASLSMAGCTKSADNDKFCQGTSMSSLRARGHNEKVTGSTHPHLLPQLALLQRSVGCRDDAALHKEAVHLLQAGRLRDVTRAAAVWAAQVGVSASLRWRMMVSRV